MIGRNMPLVKSLGIRCSRMKSITSGGEHQFKYYPNGGLTVDRIFCSEFFLKNPATRSEPDICFFWDSDQYKEYSATNDVTKVWTIIEEEGKEYLVERWQYVNRLHYLIENPKMTPKCRAYLLSRKGLTPKRLRCPQCKSLRGLNEAE